jgi:hypothetical protein
MSLGGLSTAPVAKDGLAESRGGNEPRFVEQKEPQALHLARAASVANGSAQPRRHYDMRDGALGPRARWSARSSVRS